MKEPTVFGIEEEKLNMLSDIFSLEAFYGFNRAFSSYAFELSEQTTYSLENCFKYVDSVREYLDELDCQGDIIQGTSECEGEYIGLNAQDKMQERYFKDIGDNEDVQEIFFSRGISVSLIYKLINDYHASKDELMRCDMDMLKMFPAFEEGVSMSFSFYIKAFEYYSRHFSVNGTEDTFNLYLDELLQNISIEEALEDVYGFGVVESGDLNEICSDINNIRDEMRRAATEAYLDQWFEEWADEQQHGDGTRIDADLYYDPDNPDMYTW